MCRQVIVGIVACAGLFSSVGTRAERWVLAEFGGSAAETRLPHAGWTEVIRDPHLTQYVRPDASSEHAGLAEIDGITEDQQPFFGVRGTVPIAFRRGHKIIAAFYNRSAEYAYLVARISFDDENGPDPAEPGRRWFTMHHRWFRPEGEWMPPYALVELEYYISDAPMVSAWGGAPSAGDHYLVNVNKPYHDPRFILTRLEFSDEADLAPPGAPIDLRARLIALTDGLPDHAVELSWAASSDPGLHATGVSRYLVYRDGKLYDLATTNTVAAMGNRLRYVDLNVSPGTTYRYQVTTMDQAPYGLYPTPVHPNTRVGNESQPAGPAAVTTPGWSSTDLVNPWTDLVYQGGFRLPYTEDEPWAFASSGLTYYPQGNPGYDPAKEWPGSLFGFTHQGERICEITIPLPVRSTDVTQFATARALQQPVDLWPRAYAGASTPAGGTDFKVAGMAYHPATAGVSAGLYYGVGNFYGTDPEAPSHGCFDLDLAHAVGPWHIGGRPPDNVYPGLTTRILFAAPSDWAAAHTGGRSLIVGATFLSGGLMNCTGPSLFAVAPWEQKRLPTPGEAVSAVTLLRYGSIDSLEHRSLNWNIDEFGAGGAWITAGLKSAVVISLRRTVGDVWYGDSLGNFDAFFDIPEPEFGEKGGAATDWKTGLLFYNPADLAAVARGTRESWTPQPYAVFDLDQFSLRPGGGDGTAGAIAFDAERGFLFYLEHNGDPGHEWGYSLIHAWRRARDPGPRLTARIDGSRYVIQWQTANDGAAYQLQHTPVMGPLISWTTLGPEYTGDGQVKTFSHPPAGGHANFYRLRLQPR